METETAISFSENVQKSNTREGVLADESLKKTNRAVVGLLRFKNKHDDLAKGKRG